MCMYFELTLIAFSFSSGNAGSNIESALSFNTPRLTVTITCWAA